MDPGLRRGDIGGRQAEGRPRGGLSCSAALRSSYSGASGLPGPVSVPSSGKATMRWLRRSMRTTISPRSSK